MGRRITKVLVANRGEIAVRVLRSCHEAGLRTVAVVSEADRGGLAARLAGEVVEIGPAPAAESYLRADRILEAAAQTGADAVHPGYGFLAENAGFARACAEAGLVFIGPSPEVIEAMGVKTTARETMAAAGVPVVPGARLSAEDDARSWCRTAEAVGLPLLVKAAAGGGGKGMRAVADLQALPGAIEAARREAASAFGDPTVYLERRLLRPRHVEVQILGDAHGQVVHLGERDCSVQRRHQKVIEESPAPGLDDALRERMHAAAVQAARAVGYVGAGTVEMLLDASGEFYFLEMNTRLQVEHPVSEWVHGVDLVAEQLRVAAGEPMSEAARVAPARGWSIEARLYAEDPAQQFLPQAGRVVVFEPPVGPGVRVDTGIESGDEIGLHYDPMLAKISAHGPDRESARRRLVQALRATVVLGLRTNLEHLIATLEHPAFVAGEVHTGFLADHLGQWRADASDRPAAVEDALWAAAAALLAGGGGRGHARAAGMAHPRGSLWSELGPLRLGLPAAAAHAGGEDLRQEDDHG